MSLLWLSSFLSHTTQIDQISNLLSISIEMKHGVPQGYILSPIIFLVYAMTVITSSQELGQFADDTALFD